MASSDNGELIEAGTPLTRNHWFDGKFLRADDLARDQDYHREALRLANRAGGFGVVDGLEIGLAGAELLLQPGLGITARGELLLLNGELRVGVDALIAASSVETRAAKPGLKGDATFAPCVSIGQADGPVAIDAGLRVYRLTLSRHEALCGHEDVVGALCERACVSERQRPYRLEGVRLRARRISVALTEPKGVPLDGRHRRSQIASALFARDDADPAPLPRSTGGLLSPLWCAGAELESADELTLAILVRGAGTADFVELWAGRRERMAAQAERYWRRRTRQRPYADFIAQVAQFQCQLYDSFRNAPDPGDGDEPGGDCGSLKALVADLEKQLEAAIAEGDGDGDGLARKSAARAQPLAIDWNQAASAKVMQRIGRFVESSKPLLKGRTDRVLIERGIVELPPGGFLPVRPGLDVEAQVQALLGPGVRLKVCSAPLDAIGQLFGEAQHSARTSLLHGIADPAVKPLLQLIVPDGEAQASATPQGAFAIDLQYDPALLAIALPLMLGSSSDGGAKNGLASLAATTGSALGSRLSSGLQLQAIGNKAVVGEGLGRLADAGKQPGFAFAAEGLTSAGTAPEAFAQSWMELQAERDPFTLARGESMALALELREIDRNEPSSEFPNARLAYEAEFSGGLTQLDPQLDLRGMGSLAAALEIASPAACLVELRGQLRYRLRALGLPAGQPEGFDRDRLVEVLAKLLIARGNDGTMQRWQLIWELRLPNSDVPLLIDLLWQRRHRDGRAALRMRLRSPQAPDGSQGMDTASPLANLLPEPGALAAQHPRRLAAERALLALRDGLGDGNGFLARARRRLFGDEQAASGLSGPHDWLLFRRPVDAVCSAPAPVVQPPPTPTPEPPPPPKLQNYRAWVLRLQGPSGRLPIDEAIKHLEEGQLPTEKLSALVDAGLLSFAAGVSTPQQTEAQLAAAWQAAGFGPLARVAALQESAASTDALARARFAALSPRLGGGTAEPALHRLRGSLPAPLAGSGADGVLVMLVEPPQAAPPAPEPPTRITRQHRVLLITRRAVEGSQLPFETLRDVTALSTAVNDEITRLQGISQLPLQLLNFGWPLAPGGTLEAFDNELSTLTGAVGQARGFASPPQLLCIAQANADAEALRRCREEITFLAGRINTTTQVPETAVVKAGVNLMTFSGNNLMHALTLLFVQG